MAIFNVFCEKYGQKTINTQENREDIKTKTFNMSSGYGDTKVWYTWVECRECGRICHKTVEGCFE